ncbi:hypothetical protein ACIQTT_03640 [Microbacterium sp. NPDC090225]|uniref:hypothetical protein n=1 Tax=Microbacterium sp. NPDC090225 TaxID=3364207 RepID=UPI003815D185
MTPPRIVSITAGAAFLLVALTACSAPDEAASPPTPDSASPAPQASVEPTATPDPEPTSAAFTCESMISSGTVAALTEAGWTAETKDFVIGDTTIPEDDGLLCFWGDYAVASDHGQLYGWAEMSASAASDAQTSLLASGWHREDGAEGVYITEDPQYAMGTDDDGYGMTYLFGDGWVKLADTKQGLILIEGAR